MLAVGGVFLDRGAVADRSYPFAAEVFIARLTDLPDVSLRRPARSESDRDYVAHS